MIDLEKLERLAKTATSGLAGDRVMFAVHVMDPEGILALTAEVRRLRNLLDNRPAVNAALVAEFMKWTAVVYDSDIASVRAAHPKEGV